MREGERCDVNECETVSPFQENDCFEKKKKRRTIYPVQGGVCFHPDSTVKTKVAAPDSSKQVTTDPVVFKGWCQEGGVNLFS